MDSIKRFIGSGFGSGYLPWFPGTWGSLTALISIYTLTVFLHPDHIYLFAWISALLTLWVAKACEETWGKDPGKMVIDEWAGQAVVFFTIPLSGDPGSDIALLAIGFMLFRLFDILKPLGIKRVQNMPSGYGILMDDLLAGFYALICLKTLIFVWPKITGMA